MLVLTRKKDESLVIGDDIIITIVDVRGDTVRIGVDAPKHVPVHRLEVYREIQEENRRAAASPDNLQKVSELEKLLNQEQNGEIES